MNRLLAGLLFILITPAVMASDAYFLRFKTHDKPTLNGGGPAFWMDDILLYNNTSALAAVRFVGVSNGVAAPKTTEFAIPPGIPISFNATGPVDWAPQGDPTPELWVLHLDIPSGIVAESRDEIFVATIPELQVLAISKVSMPIFRGLVPANLSQIQLGTDLSSHTSRANVIVFNGGTVNATAEIAVKRVCDNAVVASRHIEVPPNTAVQATGFPVTTDLRCPSSNVNGWLRYVTATVDQPSFVCVSNINEEIAATPDMQGFVPVVALAVAKNEQF